jgi:hypothetical protein
MSARQFAAVATASNGQQVLFYIEPDGPDLILHTVAEFSVGQVDIKASVPLAEDADPDPIYQLVQSFGTERADRALQAMREQLGELL